MMEHLLERPYTLGTIWRNNIMNTHIKITKCQYCGSTNIGVGYTLGNGRLFVDTYAYHSNSASSEIEVYLCKDCGSVLHSYVLRPEVFENIGEIRSEELEVYLEENGFLLMNEHRTLPSVCGLGYNIQNLIKLIERREVFYSKAFGNRAIYLSLRAYQLLKRVKPQKPLTEEARIILEEIKSRDRVDKDEIRKSLKMEGVKFNKAFDFLLGNLYITACAGKKINTGWYSYLYCTAEFFSEQVLGLHFSGNPKEELWRIVGKKMDKKSFELLCK